MEDTLLFDSVQDQVHKILDSEEGCHDFDHTLRVLKNARQLAEKEKCCGKMYEAVLLAALLHDCARPEEFRSCGKICHAELGAEKAAGILRSVGCQDEALIKIVSDAVGRHRFRGKNQPVNEVDKILYDADKLDSIGAVGTGRAFYFAGRLGARLHNTREEALQAAEYSRGDTAYREYLVKLRHVPGRMLTRSGRELAQDRAVFMEEFFYRMEQGL